MESEEAWGPGVSPPSRGQKGSGAVQVSPHEGAKEKQV